MNKYEFTQDDLTELRFIESHDLTPAEIKTISLNLTIYFELRRWKK